MVDVDVFEESYAGAKQDRDRVDFELVQQPAVEAPPSPKLENCGHAFAPSSYRVVFGSCDVGVEPALTSTLSAQQWIRWR
jgi:hypothetical protein